MVECAVADPVDRGDDGGGGGGEVTAVVMAAGSSEIAEDEMSLHLKVFVRFWTLDCCPMLKRLLWGCLA